MLILEIFSIFVAPLDIPWYNTTNILFMVNQKLISLKIDSKLLDQLDQLCLSRCIKRNRFINDAISELLMAYICNLSTFQFRQHLANSLPCC